MRRMTSTTQKWGLVGCLALCGLPAVPAIADDATSLADAARQGDRAAVSALLGRKVDVNAPLGDGTTALHWASARDDREMVDALLRAGASPRVTSRLGTSPLALASATGDAYLLATLLRAGADPNATSPTGVTPLMLAATSGSVSAVETLLDHGAQVNARESAHGQTALMFAAVKNRAAVIRALIRRGADPGLTSTVTSFERLSFDEDGNPIQERAPRVRTAEAAARRTEADGDAAPRQRQTGGDAAAQAAAARRASALVLGGNTALTFAARDGALAAVQALVEAGADINQPSAGDKTPPLVIAICNGHYTVAKYLLDHRADPNRTSVDGLAALYAVIDTQWAPVGWAPNPITGQEQVSYLDLMKALLEHGAMPNARLTHKLWFRPTHHDECWIGSAGATPFWRAAQATDLAAMRLLIAHGADPKTATNEGDNALMVAAGLGWNGNFSTQGPDTALATVQYCLQLGLDPTPQDVQGYTALAGAAYRGDNELVQLLVQKGAKLNARTQRGWSVTDMANGPSLRSSVPVAHPYTVSLLLKLGAPALTPVEGEEILGIIRRRPTAPASKSSTEDRVP